jgi:hypothetical protein
MYDSFFQTQRPYNKVVYKILYSDEVLRQTTVSVRNELKPKAEQPASAYEQYKKQ